MSGQVAVDLYSCSFCSKTQNQVRKLVAGPKVFICDECIDLCNDIIAEEVDYTPDEHDAEPDSAPLRPPAGELMPPQIVTRLAALNFARDMTENITAPLWVCEECGWRLRLLPDATPPIEHSYEIVLGAWPNPPRELTLLEATLAPCINAKWRKLF